MARNCTLCFMVCSGSSYAVHILTRRRFRTTARLCRLKASVGLIACDTCVFCGLTCRATHSLPSVEGTGVLWVLTGTHPCGPPPRQDGGGTRAPALTYVHTVCVYFAHVDVSRGRWFCGVSAVDSRTPPRTMSLALSFDLGCQVSNLCSQQQTEHALTGDAFVIALLNANWFCGLCLLLLGGFLCLQPGPHSRSW